MAKKVVMIEWLELQESASEKKAKTIDAGTCLTYHMKVSVSLLSYDHGIIKQIIDVFGEALKGKDLIGQRNELIEIIDFLKKFMDEFHHAKEESFFFPTVVASLSQLGGDVRGLISDHEHARTLIKVMKDEIRKDGDMNKFVESSINLVEHMNLHIEKEELKVFPKIEEGLSVEEDRRVYRQFNEFSNQFGKDWYGKSQDFANRVQGKVLGPNAFKVH